MLEMSFRDRIKMAAQKVGGLNQLSKLISIPRRTLGDQIADGEKVRLSLLLKIQKLTGYSVEWLATGKGHMLLTQNFEFEKNLNIEDLVIAIETVEEAIIKQKKKLSSQKKAKLIQKAYCMIRDENRQKEIIHLVTAA